MQYLCDEVSHVTSHLGGRCKTDANKKYVQPFQYKVTSELSTLHGTFETMVFIEIFE